MAKISSISDPSAKLIFQTEAILDSNGQAVFQNLGVSSSMSDFKIEYYLEEPIGVDP
jgi:hypothetical protein